MTIRVRTTEPIDAARADYRVFNGIVEDDVRGDNGRLAVPRGSTAELIVRRAGNNEMVLDMESLTVDGQRYAINTDPAPIGRPADAFDRVVGSIVGGIRDGNVRGQAVRIPRDTVMSFRLERALDMGIADQGVNRNGYHYHDSSPYETNGRYGRYDPNRDRGNDGNGNNGPYRNSGRFGQQNGSEQPGGLSNRARTLTVPSNQPWTDSGLNVSRGQTLHFHVTGNIQLSDNPADVGTAAGAKSGRLAGKSPLPSVTAGTFIGRINDGQPFVIGADSDVIMASDGRLSFGINDDFVPDNHGTFTVQISQP
jgi:hypothetical protein